MKCFNILLIVLISHVVLGQSIDASKYNIKVEVSPATDRFFTNDPVWRGADGAASVDMGNGKVLWLFSDGFICGDSTRLRKNSKMIRNSIAIQDGYDLNSASLKYFWDKSGKNPQAYFHLPGKTWFWTGHGAMVKDKLIIFLMHMRGVKTGLGFEAFGWYAVLISNPKGDPSKWEKQYIKGPETFGTIAGSAEVLTDEKYLYANGAVEPATHEVYLLRWKIDDVYDGNLQQPEWWMNGKWGVRKVKNPIPEPLFIGATEYSVHYDKALKKYIQVQSFGFGEGTLGLRMADSLQGKWSEPVVFYKPDYQGIKKPFMYSAKAHPELSADGIYITYNLNSFDFGELIENQSIYFPKFILVKIGK